MTEHSIHTTADLLAGLDLEASGVDEWTGAGLVMPKAVWVFGGLVGAQALMAAATTVDAKVPRSVRIRFLRQAPAHRPIRHRVTRVSDSRSFADRRVEAFADDELVATTTVVFHAPDDTPLGHQHDMVGVDPPDDDRAFAGAGFDSIDLNDPPAHSRRVASPTQRHWMRAPGTPRDDVITNAAMLTMASDLFLVASAWRPIEGRSIVDVGAVMSFGLDFTVWFHHPVAATDWHLLDVDTPSAANGRSLSFANWFRTDGLLVSSVALDAVMRVREQTETA
ncbi:MAG: acyl-CoA thioesterase domain-containing protein [Actinomycetota bacterium]